jgi:hypothetical protein
LCDWNINSFWLLPIESPTAVGLRSTKVSDPIMLRSFYTLAIFTLLGASAIALPAFAPKAEASESVALAKGDRLQVHVPVLNCANEIWPQVAARCLRSAEGSKVVEAQLVTSSH